MRSRRCARWRPATSPPAICAIAWQPMGEGRANLLARLPATTANARAPLVLSGHVDTVPLGNAPGACHRTRGSNATTGFTAAAPRT
jgi:succinyl-diaminopimelate desuccinylase